MRDFEPSTQLKVSVSPLHLRGDGVWEFVSQSETPNGAFPLWLLFTCWAPMQHLRLRRMHNNAVALETEGQ